MKRMITCILSILINVSSEAKLQCNGGLSYPFAVDGYEVAFYEYGDVFVLNSVKQ